MDNVAARAKAGKATIYRRWTSKSQLVIDAVAHLERNQANIAQLPDTGTLRGDMLALFKPQSVEESRRRLAVMSGLASLLSQDESLANAVHAAVVEPWAAVHLALMFLQGMLDGVVLPALMYQPESAAKKSLVRKVTPRTTGRAARDE